MRTQATGMHLHMIGVLPIVEAHNWYTIVYIYDHGNVPIGMQYRASTDTAWTTFWFEKNLHGDIVAVYSADGVKQLSYAYNAWGIPFATTYVNGTKAHKNPFLYRGYYYEQYLTLYRTQTRIYDPHSGRFVSPDDFSYLGANGDIISYNLYVYCSNNPVMYADPSGHFIISLSALFIGMAIGAGVGAGISFGATVYQDYADDGEIFNGSIGFDEYAGNTLGGLIAGAGVGACTVLGAAAGTAVFSGTTATLFTSSGIGITITSALGLGIGTAFTTGMVGYATSVAINSNENFNFQAMLKNGVSNSISGALSVCGGYLGGMAGLRIDLASKLLSRPSDIVKRLFVENAFSGAVKLWDKLGGN